MTINKLCLMLLLFASIDLFAQEDIDNKNKDIWITVLIHGSFSLRPHLTIKNMVKMLTDTIEESVYYRSTEINRRDPFFYKNQAMAGLGLHRIDIEHPHNNAAAPILAASFEEISRHIGNNPSDQYYTFGWSGLISNKLRYLESAFLHQDLEKLIINLKKEGLNPKIRLIGYSHGGNLALQLGALHSTKPKANQFFVDELIIFGTPIQIETDFLINSPIFKKVYNFYSRSDRVQMLDFFSFKRFFSHKKFNKRRNFRLPDKLTQIRIKITEYEPKSKDIEFDKLPTDEKDLKRYFNELNYDPGHFELWFMGWTILTYRKTFPLQPLPVLTFTPIFLKYIQENPNMPHDIVAHIKPQFNTIEFLPYRMHKKTFKATYPFFDPVLLKHMTHHALKFIPDDYNIQIYNQKVYGALNIAEYEWKEIRRLLYLERTDKKKLSESINLHKNDPVYVGHLPAPMDHPKAKF